MINNFCAQCAQRIHQRSELEEVFNGQMRLLLHEGGCPRPYVSPQPTRKIPQ